MLLRIRYRTLVLYWKKTDDNEKIKYSESKCFATSGYKKLMNNVLDLKIKNTKLVNKLDISRFINNTDLTEKIKTSAATTKF